MSDAEKAQAWLRELKTKVNRLGLEDYRGEAYLEAVDDVLRLTKPDYIQNALSVVNVVVAREATW